MPSVEVIEVENSSQLAEFIEYPNRLYRDDPFYVAPLTMERKQFFDFKKNPFYKTATVKLFLARRQEKVVGRIATCVNYTHNQYHDEQTGFFGFFDSEDDAEAASLLLKVAMITLKKAGMDKMRGPMNFSTNHDCGFLVEGFDSLPVLMMPYNRPYQPKLAEKFGLKKVMDLLAYKVTDETISPERVQAVVDRLSKRQRVNLRTLKMRDFDNEVERINDIYNQAWQQNWGFVPMSREEFFYMAKDLKQIIDPDLVFIAEYDGKPVAFSLALPNLNQALVHLHGKLFPFGLLKLLWHTKISNKIDSVRIITLGIIPEFQKRGIDSLLYASTYSRGVAKGYKWAEMSWILETNDMMRRGCEQLGGQVYKRYRVVELPL